MQGLSVDLSPLDPGGVPGQRHDAAFPANALRYCLEAGDVTLTDLAGIVFYDKPLVKFERLLETYLSYAPEGFKSFVAAMPVSFTSHCNEPSW